MPVAPAVSGLQVGELVRLRSTVEHEALLALRRRADPATLQTFAYVLSLVDDKIEARTGSAGPSLDRRAMIAAERDPRTRN